MNQQINLYQPMFRRQKKVFSSTTILQTVLIFAVAFMGIYAYAFIRLGPLNGELRKLDQNIAYLRNQKSSLEKQYPEKTKSKLIESEIARLRSELASRRQIEAMLAGDTLGNTHGFSGYLEVLARRHVQGMWLTRVAITRGGNSLGLEGRTLASDLVPLYIQQLSEEEALRGKSFNVMTLQRNEQSPSQLSFNISTE